MICLRAASAFTCVMLLSPSWASDRRMTLPLAVHASLCAPDGSCREKSLPANASLRDFLDEQAAAPAAELRLTLPAGDHPLSRSWRIDGLALPPHVSALRIRGSKAGTRLIGTVPVHARGLASTDAKRDVEIELPRDLRRELDGQLTYAGNDPAWPQLLDDQGPFRLARWPREGWAPFTNDHTLRLSEPGIPSRWRGEQAAWAWGFFKFGWHADFAPLRIERDAPHALRLAGAPRYGIGAAGRLRVLNLRSEIREPGDYVLEVARGRLRARLRGPTAGPLRITILVGPLLELRNTRHVEVADIQFADTRGHAVVVENGADVSLRDLSFENIGRAGVVVQGGREVRVERSHFDLLGEHALVLRGGDRATLTRSGHRVTGCVIRRPSQRLNTPASALRLEGVGHEVTGNRLSEMPHSALYFDGNDHVIDGNWIEHTCLDVDDAGAIYGGRDWTARGTVIRRNVFANIRASVPGGTAVAVYLDDMLSGIRVEQNVFADVDHGVLVGGGRDNLVTNNLFLRARTTLHVDERARTWAQRAVAPGEIMDQRLRAMPVAGARWRQAYPALAAMTAGRAPYPEGNVIRDNVAVSSGAPMLVPTAVQRGDVSAPTELKPSAPVADARALLDYCAREARCLPFRADGVGG